jgi:multicomponent Na+:H+ antiporter subunit F
VRATLRHRSTTCGTWCDEVNPDVAVAAFAWSTMLLVAGGLLLLRASDALQRLLALDVLGTVVIIVLTTLSYLNGVSYYIDAALALALLSFSATLLAARYITRREGRP